jgi:hypothetical protein
MEENLLYSLKYQFEEYNIEVCYRAAKRPQIQGVIKFILSIIHSKIPRNAKI